MTVVCYALFILLVGLPLVNTDTFYSTSLSAYYFYVLIGSLLTIAAGLITLVSVKAKNFTRVSFPLPIIALLFLVAYVVLRGLITSPGLNLRHYYYLVSGSVGISLFLLIKTHKLEVPVLFNCVIIIAGIEGLICLLQFLGLVNSYNAYFTATGTWVNPNVTAMFFAMSLPIAIVLARGAASQMKNVAVVSATLMLIALILLKCRTAWIATILAMLTVSIHPATLFGSFRKSKSHLRNGAAIFLMAVILFPLAIKLYNSKKASAEGRAHIWKISAQMVTRKPLAGYGYGMFDRSYNLAQAKYIASGRATAKELSSASFVAMAYNEFLENAVEGGIIGLLLFFGFLISLIVPVFRRLSHITNRTAESEQCLVAFAGVFAFCSMCLFNFTIQAVPLIPILLLYTAILSVHLLGPSTHKQWYNMVFELTAFRRVVSILLIGGGTFLTIHEYQRATADILNKKAREFAEVGRIKDALRLLGPLAGQLEMHESYWTNYGDVLSSSYDYKNAIKKYDKAARLTSNPQLFIKRGLCYQALKLYKEAESNYSLAREIEPGRIKPRLLLMKLYLASGKFRDAKESAAEILRLKPKLETAESRQYKQEAFSVIQRYKNL